jgi:hypothetical protein
MAGTPGKHEPETASAEIHDLSPDAIHEQGGTLTIKNPELARLIHSKLANAAKAAPAGAAVAARPRIRIRIDVSAA